MTFSVERLSLYFQKGGVFAIPKLRKNQTKKTNRKEKSRMQLKEGIITIHIWLESICNWLTLSVGTELQSNHIMVGTSSRLINV
jgi:hypothetical protein